MYIQVLIYPSELFKYLFDSIKWAQSVEIDSWALIVIEQELLLQDGGTSRRDVLASYLHRRRKYRRVVHL